MDSEYVNIKNYIKDFLENNKAIVQDVLDMEERYEEFSNLFSPQQLSELEGFELLKKFFPHDGDKNTLAYQLDFNSLYGSIKGGYPTAYYLYKPKKTNVWTIGSGKNSKNLSDNDAIQIATKIRDVLVEGAETIRISQLNTVDDYKNLEHKLDDLFEDSPITPHHAWVHKYYSIIFRDYIPNIHQKKMKNEMIKKFHIEPEKGYYAMDGQLYQLYNNLGIKFYSLFNENIVGLFYKFDNTVWEDFNPNNLCSIKKKGKSKKGTDKMDVDTGNIYSNFYNYLISNNYFFSKKLIENYLLSLKVKPFIILTGNSGTGKTKLSQLFAEYLNHSSYHMVDVTTRAGSWGYSEKKDEEGNQCEWTLSADDFNDILPIDEIEGTYEIEIGGYKTNANITFLPQLSYKKECEDFKNHFKELYYREQEQIKEDKKNQQVHNLQKVKVGIFYESPDTVISQDYKKSAEISLNMNINKSNNVVLPMKFMDYVPIETNVPCILECDGLFAKGTLSLKFRIGNYQTKEIKEYLKSLKENNINTFQLKIFDFNPDLTNFKSNDFLNLSNIKYNNDNYVIVPVGANWTENRNVVGYYNVLTKSYQHTPSLDLLLKAESKVKDKKPYFLILDEMNLSHVERYFSDFLSAMESNKPIPLHRNSDEDKEKEVPENIKIPDNVFIIGTVNIDETTYMFSPKVLDRANVLEFKTFEDISITNYIKNNIIEMEFEGDVDYLENPLSDVDIRENILTIVNDDFKDVKYENYSKNMNESHTDENGIIRECSVLEELTIELNRLNNYLKDSGFGFGYRTVNEILAFMVVAWKYEYKPNIWNNWRRYFDSQILQKILPKLHGSQIVLEETLNNLLICCLNLDNLDDIPKLSEIDNNYPYPESAKKLIQMKNILDKQTYVSFIN